MEIKRMDKSEIRKAFFYSILNNLNDVHINHLADLLGVNPQACREYIKFFEVDFDKKYRIQHSDEDDEWSDDWWYDYDCDLERYDNVGFFRLFNVLHPSFPCLSLNELCDVLNMELLSERERKLLKPKLIHLLSNYFYKPIHQNVEIKLSKNKTAKYWSYHDTIAVIKRCFDEKRIMKVNQACYEKVSIGKNGLREKKQVIISSEKKLSPFYFDFEKSILYAYIANKVDNIQNTNYLDIAAIHAYSIIGAEIIKDEELKEPDIINDIRVINKIDDYYREYFIDLFGAIGFKPYDGYEIVIHLNQTGRVRLLRESIHFTSYIKENKTNDWTTYPYTLKIKVVRLEEICDFIFLNIQHLILDCSKKVQIQIEETIKQKVSTYNKKIEAFKK